MNYIICKDCGWIHFAKTEKEVRDNAQKVKDYIDNLEKDIKEEYVSFSVESSVEKQKKCFRCSSKALRTATENEKPPVLATIQAIIFEKDN